MYFSMLVVLHILSRRGGQLGGGGGGGEGSWGSWYGLLGGASGHNFPLGMFADCGRDIDFLNVEGATTSGGRGGEVVYGR